MADAEQPPDGDNALQLLFEDRPMSSNPSCLSGFTDAMYSYYRSYVYPLLDYEKHKEEEWEIDYNALTELEYVGAGAFGKVYSAKLDGEVVAVKIPEDKKETDMIYLRELRHENVVRFRGVCTQGPNYCVVMEFCQYGSLYNFLHSGTRVMINRMFRWAKQVAHAMEYLHSKNIIHRDLKSPNILITDNLVCKVSDFGTSRKWEKLSMQMSTGGTTYWMAPELMLGSKCSDKVDVWSYGVVLWELLTQEVPYGNLHPCAVTYGVGRKKISLPLPSTFPLHLRILLSHCWNREPRGRPSFTRITEVLTLAWQQWGWLGDELYTTMQDSWRKEVLLCKDNGWPATLARISDVLTLAWNHSDFLGDESSRQQAQIAQDNGWQVMPQPEVQVEQPHRQNRVLYKKIMREASKMYMDACALYLRLEQREVALAEREMACVFKTPRSWINRRRNSSSSSSSHSGQLTVVKLQQSINTKVRAVTELANSGTLPKDPTRQSHEDEHDDKRKNKDLPKTHYTYKRETRRYDDKIRKVDSLPYEVSRKIDAMISKGDLKRRTEEAKRKMAASKPERKAEDSKPDDSKDSKLESKTGGKTDTNDMNGNFNKTDTVVRHISNVKDSHNNEPAAV